jgi:ribosomal protein S28E/S33
MRERMAYVFVEIRQQKLSFENGNDSIRKYTKNCTGPVATSRAELLKALLLCERVVGRMVRMANCCDLI